MLNCNENYRISEGWRIKNVFKDKKKKQAKWES